MTDREHEGPDEHDESVEPFSERADTSEQKNISDTDIVRVEENVAMSWSGVRSCCDADRIKNEVKSRFENWLGHQVTARPSYLLVNYGHGGGSVRCSQSGGGGWGGSGRSCRAGVTVKAFAEFTKR